MSEKLVAEVIRVLEEKYINPFRVLVDEECLSSGISWPTKLYNSRAWQKTCTCICIRQIGGKWINKVS